MSVHPEYDIQAAEKCLSDKLFRCGIGSFCQIMGSFGKIIGSSYPITGSLQKE
jgi:hypothetical protein